MLTPMNRRPFASLVVTVAMLLATFALLPRISSHALVVGRGCRPGVASRSRAAAGDSTDIFVGRVIGDGPEDKTGSVLRYRVDIVGPIVGNAHGNAVVVLGDRFAGNELRRHPVKPLVLGKNYLLATVLNSRDGYYYVGPRADAVTALSDDDVKRFSTPDEPEPAIAIRIETDSLQARCG